MTRWLIHRPLWSERIPSHHNKCIKGGFTNYNRHRLRLHVGPSDEILSKLLITRWLIQWFEGMIYGVKCLGGFGPCPTQRGFFSNFIFLLPAQLFQKRYFSNNVIFTEEVRAFVSLAWSSKIHTHKDINILIRDHNMFYKLTCEFNGIISLC